MANICTNIIVRNSLCNKACLKSLIKHNCWSAVILGSIMLGLGIVLRSAVFQSSSATVTSSGLLFMLIGVFIICMGPFSAIYEIMTMKNINNEQEIESEVGTSPRQSNSSEPPNYDQVVTGLKSPSATYHMQYYPQVLSPQNLSNDRPPPPSYSEIIRNQTNGSDNHFIDRNQNRRMTVV